MTKTDDAVEPQEVVSDAELSAEALLPHGRTKEQVEQLTQTSSRR